MRTTALAALLALTACHGGEILSTGAVATDGSVAADAGISPASAPVDTGETCGNGLDDNGDGQVDEGCSCDPATQPEQACYTGAGPQLGVGQCAAGKQPCQATSEEFGTWGACSGSVLPGQEDCADGIDNDCNGAVDDGPGCACKPGATRSCYTGPAATRYKGQCKDGTETCDASGTKWLACTGEVLPAKEVCEDGIDQDCDGVDTPCPGVGTICAAGTKQTATFKLDFPGHHAYCPWGQGDNGSKKNGAHAARIEHVRSMNLPPKAVLCEMTFHVPQTGMYYDDSMLLAFADAVLAAGRVNVPKLFPATNGLHLYNWSQMKHRNAEHLKWCIGSSSCQMPDTEASGSISLTLDPTSNQALTQRALDLNRFDFKVVATGDDNPEDDCTYSAFTLEVTATYVVQP
jgi:hypothetical protein